MAKGWQVDGLKIAKARLALPGPPSQAEFASRVGIHWVTQSRIETGKAKVSLDLLERIASETGEAREAFLPGDETTVDSDDEESHQAMLDSLSPTKREKVERAVAALTDVLLEAVA